MPGLDDTEATAPPAPGGARRAAAVAALLLPPAVLVLAVVLTVQRFPRGLVVLGCVATALAASLWGVIRTGLARALAFGIALAALSGAAAALLAGRDDLPWIAALIAGTLLAVLAARIAFRARVALPDAEPPDRPVLFFNPLSGGGKAERFALAEEARARGIEPIELTRGSDLEGLVRDAVSDGADGLAMAGGDGSQAIVAAIAAELGVPYACIPAGTRNHFALDLGVDRDDVVGALDAFVNGGERRVDLAEVNGRVFVNNVSLGLYAVAVQKPGYREAKLKTLLETVPEAVGTDGRGIDLRWDGPGGAEHSAGAAILVSNNMYRLGRAVGSGTRPRIDDGLLGITVASAPVGRGSRARLPQRPWREWSAPEFEVDAEQPVAAGIDGEAAMLEPPLRFRIHPGVLRVRIARSHPGCSPSAVIPATVRSCVRALAGIAAGRDLAGPGRGGPRTSS
ncbi:MAG: diacylglycerol/lipid kinase family protein [Solirubrobacterales bacterium]